MATRAYKLRSEYEGALVGGRFRTGPDSEADVKELLDANGGEIVTEDPILQSVLENYYGVNGRVFDVTEVDTASGEHVPVELPTEQNSVVSVPDTTATGATASVIPGAEHGSVSEYGGLLPEELRQTALERGLNVSKRSTPEELISAIEADDAQRQEGVNSGS